MKIWYDCEFHERGPAFPIDLISIGMVREDGAELYLVNGDCDWRAVLRNDWLRENVVPNLPVLGSPVGRGHGPVRLDTTDPRVQPREVVAAQVKQFLSEAAPRLELWAWYADYDHVVLSQLFGTMIQLPDFVPMYTRDLKQEADRLEVRLNEEAIRASIGAENQHDALADARYVAEMAKVIRFTAGLNRRGTNA